MSGLVARKGPDDKRERERKRGKRKPHLEQDGGVRGNGGQRDVGRGQGLGVRGKPQDNCTTGALNQRVPSSGGSPASVSPDQPRKKWWEGRTLAGSGHGWLAAHGTKDARHTTAAGDKAASVKQQSV